MNGFPWLTIAGAVPLLGAIVIMLVPGLPADSAEADVRARQGLAKYLALAFSLITLVVVIIIAVKFQIGGPTFQFTEVYSWIPAFGAVRLSRTSAIRSSATHCAKVFSRSAARFPAEELSAESSAPMPK